MALFDFKAEQGELLAAELGGVFCKVDVTSESEVDAVFAKARGQERVLINRAGTDTGNAIKTASRDKASGTIKFFPLLDLHADVVFGTVTVS
jgi:NADP-dependent 3-hydroxy acid dehydrogenase YdfG